MQVEFQYVKFKNLMSYGNAETHIVLNQHKHTLITAKNGGGKSSVVEALFYGAYGVPYRKIKVGQLVNTINKKGLMVEIGLKSNGKQYKIIRGQKPSIFQIYEDGVLVQEDAAARDYQQFLETKILCINQRSFRQIVCIGSASYKPFMDLSAAERRAITEEVLDISIFTSMQDIAKKRVSELKSAVDSLTTEISMFKSQITSNKTMLDQLVAEKTSRDAEEDSKRTKLQTLLEEATIDLDTVKEQLEQMGADDLSDKLQRTRTALQGAKSRLSTEEYKLAQYTHNLNHDDTTCPTCNQQYPVDMRAELKAAEQAKHDKCVADIQQLTKIIAELTEKESTLCAADQQYRAVESQVTDARATVRSLKTQLQALTYTDNSVTIKLCKDTIQALAASVIEKSNEKAEHSRNLLYYKTAVDLLKDDGVKSRVIATFIPIMNEYINEYLQKFDMFIKFELDEYFNERILSRGRDSFTYNSFSQGEKQKIDIAILMAWRKVAMMRSSVSCNLLIFDETMDSSLDTESIDIFVDVLGGVEETVNSMVVSHRATIVPEIFDRHIAISKVRDFSIVKET